MEKTNKIKNKILNIIKIIIVMILLILIFLIAPKLTELTKNIVVFLYELEAEYITRFWTVLLSLSITIVLFFEKNEKK